MDSSQKHPQVRFSHVFSMALEHSRKGTRTVDFSSRRCEKRPREDLNRGLFERPPLRKNARGGT